jgi:hypothetical protein
MHPCLGGVNFEQSAQVDAQGVLQKIAPLTIVVEHTAQMAGKMTLAQKVGQGHLLQNGDVDIDKAPCGQQESKRMDGSAPEPSIHFALFP